MVEACAAGAIKPAPLGGDQFQRVKEEWLLRTQESVILRRLDELVYMWHCATAQLVAWDEKAKVFEFNHKKAKELYSTIGRDAMPWYDGWSKHKSTTVELWERFKAMQEDPKEQAFVRQFRSELEAEAERLNTEEASRVEALGAYERIRKKRAAANGRRV